MSHDSAAWKRLRAARLAQARAEGEPCVRCAKPIDYTLSGRVRLGPTVDHLHPLAISGREAGDAALGELGPAHRTCNSRHGAAMGNRLRAHANRAPQQRDHHPRRPGQRFFPAGPTDHPGPGSPSLPGARTPARGGPGAPGTAAPAPGAPESGPRRAATATEPPNAGPDATLPEQGPQIESSRVSGGVAGGVDEFTATWADYPWLAWLLPVPETATLPRLMTGPHPRAAGSHGQAAVAWIEARRAADPRVPAKAKTLRWWQKWALCRQLEHGQDEDDLIWAEMILSTGRQVGKSVLLSERSAWRIHEGPALFGEPQLVLHIAKDLAVAREVQRVIRLWATDIEEAAKGSARAASPNSRLPRTYRPTYIVRGTHGAEEIETADSSRWLIRGKDSCYGYSASSGEVDEAWGLPAAVVEEGIEATSAEREAPQLLLTSTAHPAATDLVPRRRRAAMAALAAPAPDTRTLLLEWSADPAWDPGGDEAMRAASPHWDHRRQRLLAAKHAQWVAGEEAKGEAAGGGYPCQWLNIWPDTAGAAPKWLDPRQWARCLTPDMAWNRGATLVVGISLDHAHGTWPVIVAGPTGTRIGIRLLGAPPTQADAVKLAATSIAGHRAHLIAPRMLRGHLRVPGCTEPAIMGEADVAAAREITRYWLGTLQLAGDPANTTLTDALTGLPARREPGRFDAATMAQLGAWWAARNPGAGAIVV